MAYFIIRVELKEEPYDYDAVHKIMDKNKAYQILTGDDGQFSAAPTAMYAIASTAHADVKSLRNSLIIDLDTMQKRFWILVIESKAAAWMTDGNALAGPMFNARLLS